MYIDFSVTHITANFSDKTITIHTNFIVDNTTVNFNSVMFFFSIHGEDNDISNIKKAIREGKIKIVGGQLPTAINNIKPVKEAKKEKPVKIKEEKIEIIIPVAENKKQPKTTTAIKKKEEPKIEPKKE